MHGQHGYVRQLRSLECELCLCFTEVHSIVCYTVEEEVITKNVSIRRKMDEARQGDEPNKRYSSAAWRGHADERTRLMESSWYHHVRESYL